MSKFLKNFILISTIIIVGLVACQFYVSYKDRAYQIAHSQYMVIDGNGNVFFTNAPEFNYPYLRFVDSYGNSVLIQGNYTIETIIQD